MNNRGGAAITAEEQHQRDRSSGPGFTAETAEKRRGRRAQARHREGDYPAVTETLTFIWVALVVLATVLLSMKTVVGTAKADPVVFGQFGIVAPAKLSDRPFVRVFFEDIPTKNGVVPDLTKYADARNRETGGNITGQIGRLAGLRERKGDVIGAILGQRFMFVQRGYYERLIVVPGARVESESARRVGAASRIVVPRDIDNDVRGWRLSKVHDLEPPLVGALVTGKNELIDRDVRAQLLEFGVLGSDELAGKNNRLSFVDRVLQTADDYERNANQRADSNFDNSRDDLKAAGLAAAIAVALVASSIGLLLWAYFAHGWRKKIVLAFIGEIIVVLAPLAAILISYRANTWRLGLTFFCCRLSRRLRLL